MTLDIVKVTRKGKIIEVTITQASLPYQRQSKATRKLKSLYKAARDSSNVVLEDPILLINGISFPMRKSEDKLVWHLTVEPRGNFQVSYGGQLHDVGPL